MKTRSIRTIAPVLLILIILGVVFAFSAHAAEGDPEMGPGGSIAKGLISPSLFVLNGVLYIIRALVWYILSFSSMLLTKLFWFNLIAVPTAVPAVLIMWAALRDLTNGIFLLAILWVSLTIIFNIENYGGKRLLMRVVMVALLINFSLLMVTMVFGIANRIGLIFAKNMPADPGLFIVTAIDAQNVGTIFSKERLEEIRKEEDKKAQQLQGQISSASPNVGSPLKETLLASIGVPTAEAATDNFWLGCGAGLIGAAVGIGLAKFTVGVSLVGGVKFAAAMCGFSALYNHFTGAVTGLLNTAANTSVQLLAQILFLSLTAFTMLYGAIVLLIRYAVMVALSAVAPVAFAAAMVPQTKQYFDLWVSTLLRWAFFLPMFYVMMYLGFFIISGIDSGATRGFGPTSLDRIMIVLVGVLFMWMGLRIAKKTGGAIAESALGGLSKIGLFAAGGAAGLAMRGAGAAIAAQPERAQEWAARARRIPLVGRQIQQAMGLPMEQNRKNVEARAKEMENYSNDQLVTHFRQAKNSKEKAAAAILLARRKKTKKLDRTGEPQQAVEYTKRFGLHKDVIKENPHLATPDMFPEAKGNRLKAIMYAMKDVTDKMTLPREAYDDKETMLALISSIRGKRELEKINREAPALYTRIREVIEANKQEMEGIYNDLDAEGGVRDAGKALRKTLEEYHIAHLAGGRRRRQGRARNVVTPEEARQEEFEDRQRARENRGNQA